MICVCCAYVREKVREKDKEKEKGKDREVAAVN